ncbi:hypothetical protein ECRM12581_13330 [Escherichia coli O145:H28 str. RM12581]|uniref:Uncharacterized protein n=1 Tax=Escherichia coli O145:H28 (strain RM12581) TaxID=1248823 RepID=A0ABC7ZTQ4_ECOLR|nr:hypothetical protein ECRM13514_2706 [Escherichia coli O145:H28 str. RM13514]AHY71196.1 hypothetical protein ECRM12581_13330 [Escherichia coli O145:H28 str. RM12581]
MTKLPLIASLPVSKRTNVPSGMLNPTGAVIESPSTLSQNALP